MQQDVLFVYDTPITDADVLSVVPLDRWVSMREIAVALRRAKTPSLRARVMSLVENGDLAFTTYTLPNRVDMHLFRARTMQELGELAGKELRKTE